MHYPKLISLLLWSFYLSSCKVAGGRRSKDLPGGLIEQDPNDPIYRPLAEESLQKYVSESVNKIPHTLLKVERVTTQVVAGSITRIDFVAVQNDIILPLVKKCHSEIFEQKWVNKKEITVTCEIDSNRSRRQLWFGPKEENPNDPKYIPLAEESLQKYVLENAEIPHKLLKVERVTIQVVAGSLTSIDFLAAPSDNLSFVQKCHSEIWEQKWLNKKEIKVSCEIESSRFKRQVGAIYNNPNNPLYTMLAEKSLEKYILESAGKIAHKLLKVESVTNQRVKSSFITSIDFLAAPLDNLSFVKKCHSEILETPKLTKNRITVSCEIDTHRLKRRVAGGSVEQDPNDHIYRPLAEESLQKYVLENAEIPHKLLKVERVTTQVVAGSITSIDFLAAPSDNLSFVKNCHSEIFEQKWVNKKEINVSCDIDYYRSKRQVPIIIGGWEKQNPNDPIYRPYAEESLQKYVWESTDKTPLKLVKVESVSTQLVNGYNYRIDFVAVPINPHVGFVRKCHSEIFEPPPHEHNKNKINVSCEIDYYRSKRQVPIIIGGWVKQNPNDPIYRPYAEESLQKYVWESTDKTPLKLVKVESVSTQLVNGYNYRIDFVAVPINPHVGFVRQCHSEIFEPPPHEHNKNKINVSCEIDNHLLKRQVPEGWEEHNSNVPVHRQLSDNYSSKRHPLIGGVTEQDPNDPIYRPLAEESLQKYVLENAEIPHKLLNVERVTTQVVAGSITTIDFYAQPSGIHLTIPFLKICHSEIFQQEWIHRKDIKVSCKPTLFKQN